MVLTVLLEMCLCGGVLHGSSDSERPVSCAPRPAPSRSRRRLSRAERRGAEIFLILLIFNSIHNLYMYHPDSTDYGLRICISGRTADSTG